MHATLKILLASASFGLALIASGCGDKAAGATAAPPTPMVTVAAPLKESVTDWNEFVGRFEPTQHVDVRARAGGFLQSVNFTDGQTVKKGQLLFTLDPRPAQAALASAQADEVVARKAFDRGAMLMQEGAISKEEFDKRRATLDVASAALRARQLDLEFTRVVAPASGTVSDRKVDAGNVITGGSSAGDLLTTIVSTSPIYFSFEVSESEMLKYQRQAEKNGGRIEIRLQDEPDYTWTGVVDFSDNAISDGAGTLRMRAKVDNPKGFLKPGMFGHARVASAQQYDAMLIPDTAVVSDGPRKIVYVVGAGGEVGVKPLETGPVVDGLRVVRSGLDASDQVIVNGVQRAQPGMTVQAKPTTITRTAELDLPKTTRAE
ncbi:Multidrug-efflux system secretion protein, HlyD family [uncultured Defluviicoccus sp.]|uniref:Multidrug-efflux system secretion protein, HlyD family n=1 Tax=metagenome TaxID=256318 RepID=A0A380T973_9ZZZZ|nr:Multidrug-efflux system secretion protein, HlyD family [uncultured Defluviicoccus sp.]